MEFNSYLFAHSKMVTNSENDYRVLVDLQMGSQQVLPLRVRVYREEKANKRNTPFSKASGLEPRHQMQFSVM